MRMALRPYDLVDATERRRDEQDLAWLRRVCSVTAPKRSWRRHWPIWRCWRADEAPEGTAPGQLTRANFHASIHGVMKSPNRART
jgi:hypothetical protein